MRLKFVSAIFFVCFIASLFLIISWDCRKVEKSDKNENGGKLVIFQKNLPSGDSKPDEQPWTLPNVFVYENVENFTRMLQSEKNDIFLTSNFFISPGMGNLMFLYATLYAVSLENKMALLVPHGILLRRSFYLGQDQKSSHDVIVSDRISQYLLKQWKNRLVFQECCKFFPEVLDLNRSRGTPSPANTVLMGYFQSYKYFHKYGAEIRSKFRFLADVQNMALRTVDKALRKSGRNRENTVLVGVHARRGVDLAWNLRNQVHGHTVAPRSYFLKAMDFYRQRYNNGSHTVLFLILSDDSFWCRQNLLRHSNHSGVDSRRINENLKNSKIDLKIKKNYSENHINDGYGTDAHVVATSQKTREVDLAVLAHCQHTVMSTGTFSWWAAYLAGGQAIFYEYWPRPGSPLASMLNREDYFLPDWIPMM